MKNYLNFSLTGKQIVPVWISFLLLFLAPYIGVIVFLQRLNLREGEGLYLIPILLVLVIIFIAFVFFMNRLIINGIEYKEKHLDFDGKFGEFLGILLLGILLSIITMGIYLPWFNTRLQKFFIGKTSLNGEHFSFLSKGWQLLIIYVFTALIPVSLLTAIIVSGIRFLHFPEYISTLSGILNYIVLTPYMYLVYKWIVNVSYKNYIISWRTNFFSSVGFIFGQFVLSMITVGIYAPMAGLQLYRFFISRTYAISDESTRKFGFDDLGFKDFLFMWGQLLLILITVGIYLPWGYCKITHRYLSRTYLEEAI